MKEILETLNEAYSYSQRLTSGINSAIKCFEQKEYEKGKDYIVLIIDGISWLLAIFETTQEEQVEKIEKENVNEFLEEGIEALRNKDYRVLKELLEYELMEVVSEWSQKLLYNIQQLEKVEH